MTGRTRWLAALLACAAARPAGAALTQLSAGRGETRDLLRTSATTLYAATQGGGLWKSADAGVTWNRVATLPARFVWRLAGDPANSQLVLAATSQGLFRTTNDGASFTQLTFDDVRAVAVDPFAPLHVLVGVPGAGVLASSDQGTSFLLSAGGLDSLDVTALAFDPASPGTVYVGLNSGGASPAGDWGGVFKSSDGGATWASWNNPAGGSCPGTCIGNRFVTALAVAAGGTLIAGTYDLNTGSGPLYTQSGSGSWSGSPSPPPAGSEVYGVQAIAVDANAATKVWAASRGYGVFLSTNTGASWSGAVNPASDPDLYNAVGALLTFPGVPNRVLAGVKGLGLYQTVNNGTSWPRPAGQPRADRARALAASSATTLFLGLDGGGVMRTLDGGVVWTAVNTGLSVPGVEQTLGVKRLSISATNASLLYAAAEGRGLFKTTTAGTTCTWSAVAESGLVNSGYLKPQGLAVLPSDDRNVFYSLFDTGNGVLRRETGGTWTTLPLVAAPYAPSRLVLSPTLVASLASTRLYALLFDAVPQWSGNGGASWTQVAASAPGFSRLAAEALSENPLNANAILVSTSKGLVRSSAGPGAAFARVPVSGPLGSLVPSALAFSPTTNGLVFAGDRGGGWTCSLDGGTTWQQKADPALFSPILDLRFVGSTLYLVTDGSGLLKDAAPTCP